MCYGLAGDRHTDLITHGTILRTSFSVDLSLTHTDTSLHDIRTNQVCSLLLNLIRACDINTVCVVDILSVGLCVKVGRLHRRVSWRFSLGNRSRMVSVQTKICSTYGTRLHDVIKYQVLQSVCWDGNLQFSGQGLRLSSYVGPDSIHNNDNPICTGQCDGLQQTCTFFWVFSRIKMRVLTHLMQIISLHISFHCQWQSLPLSHQIHIVFKPIFTGKRCSVQLIRRLKCNQTCCIYTDHSSSTLSVFTGHREKYLPISV